MNAKGRAGTQVPLHPRSLPTPNRHTLSRSPGQDEEAPRSAPQGRVKGASKAGVLLLAVSQGQLRESDYKQTS